MKENWIVQSVVAMLCFVPVWLANGFLNRNYQIRPDVFLVWYLLGVIVTTIIFGGLSFNIVAPSGKLVVTMLLFGLTTGAVANILLFRAVLNAPNPGLPLAIVNVTSIVVFFAAVLLFQLAPKYFNSAKIDVWSFLGVALTVIGASLIAIRR